MKQGSTAALATLALALALGSDAAQAQAVAYRLDPDLTRVHWEVLHFATSTSRGRFDRIDGSIALDRANGRGEVSIVIDTASVSTGLAVFDSVLRGDGMLAATAHPAAYFVAREFRFDGERLASLRGELTLRGISRPLTLTALRFVCRPVDAGGERCGGDFEAELRRSDFGITAALPFAADRVRLLVVVQAQRP